MKEAKRFSAPEHSRPELFVHPGKPDPRGRIFVPALWMVGISLILFFVPVINGLIGGFVGGAKAGNIKSALIAAILPAILVAAGLWGLLAVMEMPVIGLFAGTALGVWIVFADIGLFLGAAIGGAIAKKG